MAIERTVYGQAPPGKSDDEEDREYTQVYKIEEEHDGTVWVTTLGAFYSRETAHAFCRAWNGEPGPK